MIRSVIFYSFVCTLFVCQSAKVVQAQDGVLPIDQFGFKDDSARKGSISVLSSNDYGAPAMRWKGFSILARMNTEEHYDSNIYALESDEVSDFSTQFEPTLKIDKEIGRHSLSFEAEGDGRLFAEHSDENTFGGQLTASARLEAYRSFIVPLEFSIKRGHAKRHRQRDLTLGSLTEKPISYDDISARGGFVYKPNRLAVTSEAGVLSRRYENEIRRNGDLSVVDDGDFDRVFGRAKISYEMPTGFVPYIEGRVESNDFLNRKYLAGNGYAGDDKSNSVLLARAGLSFKYKGLVVADVAVGQERRSYDQADIGDVQSLSLAGSLGLVFSPKMRTDLAVYAYNDEDSLLNDGVERTGFNLGVDYELRKDVFSFLDLSYEDEQYSTIGREDQTWGFSGGLRYMMSPDTQISAEYENMSRDSNVVNGDMDRHVVIVRVKNSL